jgi:hypothetical protein
VPPVRVMGVELDLKELVTRYLDATFYNLTTVTPQV